MKSLRREKDPRFNTKQDFDFLENLEQYFSDSQGTNVEKLSNFAKYATRQDLTTFLSRYELFKKVLDVQGSIVECGVLMGGGLMTYAKLSSIFEPVNYQRKIIGFDTFAGFASISKKDAGSDSSFLYKGGLKADFFDDLKKAVELYDSNRFLNHIPKVELIKGDAVKTIPKYLKDNPQTVVSLLYLDFDLYEPTKVSLANFLPRMPKGAIIAFDELNSKGFTGETIAAIEAVDIRKLRLRRFNFATSLSYAILD